MKKTSHHKKQTKINTEEYANIFTGATLDSDIGPMGTAYTKVPTGAFSIESSDFVSFDRASIDYLSQKLNRPNMARVLMMGAMLHTEYSVLYHTNMKPHTSETLYTALGMSHDEFYRFANLLMDIGVLEYKVLSSSGYVQKLYMLNPYIVRKRKTFNSELLLLFKDVTEVNN